VADHPAFAPDQPAELLIDEVDVGLLVHRGREVGTIQVYRQPFEGTELELVRAVVPNQPRALGRTQTLERLTDRAEDRVGRLGHHDLEIAELDLPFFAQHGAAAGQLAHPCRLKDVVERILEDLAVVEGLSAGVDAGDYQVTDHRRRGRLGPLKQHRLFS
jgi:hypothetical protein